MSRLTTDRNDPDLGYGVDTEPVSQNQAYLVLSKEELAKGFVRPVRTSYIHVGLKKPANLRDLTEEENTRYSQFEYFKYEKYPESDSSVTGRYCTKKQLAKVENGCQEITRMSREIAETYARNPKFYGATYCVGCQMHLPVEEFVWLDNPDQRVGE